MEPRDSTPEGAVGAARDALEKGDLPRATRHVAAALAEDPNRSEWLALLDNIIEATDDPDDLLPDDDLPLPSAQAAVRAHILAHQGRVADAIQQLLEVVSSRPDVLYLDWALGWLQRPEAAGKLDLDKVAAFLGSLIEQLPAMTSPHGGGRETLARMPVFVQLIRRTQPADASFLAVSAGLLGRLGHRDESLKLAREAHALDPGLHSAVTLAMTHAAREEIDQALESFREALRHEPGDISARLGIADLLANNGKHKEAREMFAEVLEREPEQETALPSFYFLNFTEAGDESWRDKLLAYAESHEDNDRARRLAQQATPFVGYLPEPTDLPAALRRPPDSKPGRPLVELTTLIAPSNYLAHDWLKSADVTVARIPTPDPRPPRRWVEYLLWKYDGLRPSIAVPPPSGAIAWSVVELANQQFQLEMWWQQARRLARQLKPEQFDDLLATMVYPPRPQQVNRLVGWVYRIQVATALVIAHFDTGWEGSLRRKALFSLANGPMDWTTDAALVALTAVARDEDDAAPEILKLFRELRGKLPKDGPVCYEQALLWGMLRLPGVEDEERSAVRAQLRRWQDAQRAEPKFRQALAHVEKRSFDEAATELAEVVRLDPAHADAFLERANLLLRRGDGKQALTDYTRAIELRPAAPGGYLGRGRAHLKLGQFDQAIDDFSAVAKLAPTEWEAYHRRGLAHTARKNPEQAIADFSQAIRLQPDSSELYLHRALAYSQIGRLDLAIGDYSEQIRLNPQAPAAYNFRARLYSRQGRYAAAIDDHVRACELDPANAGTHSQLARLWATCADATLRDGRRAVEHATKACELTEWKAAHCLDVLAAAHAEHGQFEEAAHWAEKALALASAGEQAEYTTRLEAYRQGRRAGTN